MSNLTPEIEEAFFWLKEMCTDASKGDPDIGPLTIRDKIVELGGLVEDVLTPKCTGCGEPMAQWEADLTLCLDCFRNQEQKAATWNVCCVCSGKFYGAPNQPLCGSCLDDEARAEMEHREEVQRAHAATNGTL